VDPAVFPICTKAPIVVKFAVVGDESPCGIVDFLRFSCRNCGGRYRLGPKALVVVNSEILRITCVLLGKFNSASRIILAE